MQRQPTSLFLVADAYRQELLADAARVRSVPDRRAERRPARSPLGRCRHALAGLVPLARRPLAPAPRRGQPGGQGLLAVPSPTPLPE